MSAPEFMALLVFVCAMSFSPGPNNTLSAALAVNHGLQHALRFCLAVPTGWMLLMLTCGLGVGALVNGVPAFRWAIKLAGAAYLSWLAWKLARTSQLSPMQARSLDVTYLQGVGMQFINIKAWMLALTITAGWVVNAGGQPASNPGQRLFIVCMLMPGIVFSSNFIYALAGALLRDTLSRGNRLVWFNRSLGLILMLTAVWILQV